jgi:hypothetical protein
MAVMALGYLGIGQTIASLARTQRRASMGALCYILTIALLLAICSQNNIYYLPNLTLEYHIPKMLYAALSDTVLLPHWLNLLQAAVLVVAWVSLASFLFRRRGWQ